MLLFTSCVLVTQDYYNLLPVNSDDPGGSRSVVGESCGIFPAKCDIMLYIVIM